MARPASAQNCLQTEAGRSLTCTANDVSVAFANNPRSLTGAPLLSCQAGSTFSFVADFHVTTTATQRQNIELYFQTGGGPNALTGTCSDNIISPPHFSSNQADSVCLGSGATATAAAGPCSGQGTYESSASPNTCGEITTSDNNQVITVEVDNALCQAAPGTNQVALPNCTSWQQSGGVTSCVSGPPNWPFEPAPPGSPSKCNCENNFTVPIEVQSPSVSVTKTCSLPGTSQTDLSSCTFATTSDPEGGSVTYTVTVNNSSNFGQITLDQICDSAYGNIATASGFATACAGGTVGTASSTTCAMPQTIAQNGSYSCTFAATQGENTTVQDVATGNGLGSDGKTPFTGSSTQVTVVSTDFPSTATITKSLNSIQQACATVRYNVGVTNTSQGDENITLTGLTDSAYGNIVPNQSANVLATTCTEPQSLSVGSAPYNCTFDAQFCAAPSTIITTAGVCGASGTCTAGKTGSTCTQNSACNVTCNGIQHTNTVNGTFTGDEAADTVTATTGTTTVNVCLTTQ